MSVIGFTNYDAPVPVQTVQEILDSLSNAQKVAVLDSFKQGIGIVDAKAIANTESRVVRTLYLAIKDVEETSRKYMRGEVVITPAVYDEDGVEISPAVYNTPPVDSAELLATIQDFYTDTFNSTQVQAILTEMVKYSKSDGSGDWAFYSAEVVK